MKISNVISTEFMRSSIHELLENMQQKIIYETVKQLQFSIL